MVLFEILGDSNVARNWKTVLEYYEPLKSSISRSTTSLSALRDNLKTVSQTTENLVVASLTNPLTNITIDNIDTMRTVCTDRLKEMFELLSKTLTSNARLKVIFYHLCPFIRARPVHIMVIFTPIYPLFSDYVLPPMNRPRPYWYHENYTFVAQSFARVFTHLSARMFILAPFECPPNRWEPDGTHLTPGEGERCSFSLI
jgi:hypothetical protein